MRTELDDRAAVLSAMSSHHDALLVDIECRAQRREEVCRTRSAAMLRAVEGLVADLAAFLLLLLACFCACLALWPAVHRAADSGLSMQLCPRSLSDLLTDCTVACNCKVVTMTPPRAGSPGCGRC